MDIGPFRSFAMELVAASEDVILPLFRRADLEVIEKSDDTPVTQADRGAEAVIRKLINQRYPDHGIIGEEYGTENEEAEFVWVLDPVDGTFSFARGIPLFGTLICLKYQGQPVMGVINQPIMKECVIGDPSLTTLNGEQVKCSEVSQMDRALFLTTDSRRAAKLQPHTQFDALVEKCRLFRTWGDAYGYLMVATGRAEAMFDPIVNEWDFIGHVPILQGAGGRVSDWDGNDPVGAESVICTNAALYDEVMTILHDKQPNPSAS